MYSRSVTPIPGEDDQDEVRDDQSSQYSLSTICWREPAASSVQYFNYSTKQSQPAKNLAQEILDGEYVERESEKLENESSRLLGDTEEDTNT